MRVRGVGAGREGGGGRGGRGRTGRERNILRRFEREDLIIIARVLSRKVRSFMWNVPKTAAVRRRHLRCLTPLNGLK